MGGNLSQRCLQTFISQRNARNDWKNLIKNKTAVLIFLEIAFIDCKALDAVCIRSRIRILSFASQSEIIDDMVYRKRVVAVLFIGEMENLMDINIQMRDYLSGGKEKVVRQVKGYPDLRSFIELDAVHCRNHLRKSELHRNLEMLLDFYIIKHINSETFHVCSLKQAFDRNIRRIFTAYRKLNISVWSKNRIAEIYRNRPDSGKNAIAVIIFYIYIHISGHVIADICSLCYRIQSGRSKFQVHRRNHLRKVLAIWNIYLRDAYI